MPHPNDEFDDRPPRARRVDNDDDADDDELERPSRRQRERARRSDEFEPTQLIVPQGVSAYSIIACYAGLIGMCLPGFGLVFAIPAFICAIVALRQRKKAASYGAVTSDLRAIAGLVMSSIGILVGLGMVTLLVIGNLKK